MTAGAETGGSSSCEFEEPELESEEEEGGGGGICKLGGRLCCLFLC